MFHGMIIRSVACYFYIQIGSTMARHYHETKKKVINIYLERRESVIIIGLLYIIKKKFNIK